MKHLIDLGGKLKIKSSFHIGVVCGLCVYVSIYGCPHWPQGSRGSFLVALGYVWFLSWIQQYLIDESDLYNVPRHHLYFLAILKALCFFCLLLVANLSCKYSGEEGRAMGGGNGQKSKMARQRNMEKQKAAAKGTLKSKF